MTDETNLLDPAFVGVASTFAASNDDAPATGQQSGTWWVPGDAYNSVRGLAARRMFSTDTLVTGTLLFSQYVVIPATITVATMLWDMGSWHIGSNIAAGGYGLQVNKVSTERRLEFLWRDAGDDTTASALLSYDIDSTGVVYPPLISDNAKFGDIFHVGAVINMLPEGRFVDLYLDGNLVATDMLASGENVSVNASTGLTQWANSINKDETNPLSKIMNNVDTGFKTSSFFAQRIESDRSDKAAQIMGDAMMLRQGRPARSRKI